MKLKKGYLQIALFSIFLDRNLHSIQSFYLLYWYFSQHFSGKHCQSDFSRYQLHFFPFSCREEAFSHFPKSNNVLFCGGNLIEFSERLVSLELVGRKDKHLSFNILSSNSFNLNLKMVQLSLSKCSRFIWKAFFYHLRL